MSNPLIDRFTPWACSISIEGSFTVRLDPWLVISDSIDALRRFSMLYREIYGTPLVTYIRFIRYWPWESLAKGLHCSDLVWIQLSIIGISDATRQLSLPSRFRLDTVSFRRRSPKEFRFAVFTCFFVQERFCRRWSKVRLKSSRLARALPFQVLVYRFSRTNDRKSILKSWGRTYRITLKCLHGVLCE
jgi:hypothetical protein